MHYYKNVIKHRATALGIYDSKLSKTHFIVEMPKNHIKFAR